MKRLFSFIFLSLVVSITTINASAAAAKAGAETKKVHVVLASKHPKTGVWSFLHKWSAIEKCYTALTGTQQIDDNQTIETILKTNTPNTYGSLELLNMSNAIKDHTYSNGVLHIIALNPDTEFYTSELLYAFENDDPNKPTHYYRWLSTEDFFKKENLSSIYNEKYNAELLRHIQKNWEKIKPILEGKDIKREKELEAVPAPKGGSVAKPAPAPAAPPAPAPMPAPASSPPAAALAPTPAPAAMPASVHAVAATPVDVKAKEEIRASAEPSKTQTKLRILVASKNVDGTWSFLFTEPGANGIKPRQFSAISGEIIKSDTLHAIKLKNAIQTIITEKTYGKYYSLDDQFDWEKRYERLEGDELLFIIPTLPSAKFISGTELATVAKQHGNHSDFRRATEADIQKYTPKKELRWLNIPFDKKFLNILKDHWNHIKSTLEGKEVTAGEIKARVEAGKAVTASLNPASAAALAAAAPAPRPTPAPASAMSAAEIAAAARAPVPATKNLAGIASPAKKMHVLLASYDQKTQKWSLLFAHPTPGTRFAIEPKDRFSAIRDTPNPNESPEVTIARMLTEQTYALYGKMDQLEWGLKYINEDEYPDGVIYIIPTKSTQFIPGNTLTPHAARQGKTSIDNYKRLDEDQIIGIKENMQTYVWNDKLFDQTLLNFLKTNWKKEIKPTLEGKIKAKELRAIDVDVKMAKEPGKAGEALYLLASKDRHPITKEMVWRFLFVLPSNQKEFTAMQRSNAPGAPAQYKDIITQLTYGLYHNPDKQLFADPNYQVLLGFNKIPLHIIPVKEIIRGGPLAAAAFVAKETKRGTPIKDFSWLPVTEFLYKDKSQVKHGKKISQQSLDAVNAIDEELGFNPQLLQCIADNWNSINLKLEQAESEVELKRKAEPLPKPDADVKKAREGAKAIAGKSGIPAAAPLTKGDVARIAPIIYDFSAGHKDDLLKFLFESAPEILTRFATQSEKGRLWMLHEAIIKNDLQALKIVLQTNPNLDEIDYMYVGMGHSIPVTALMHAAAKGFTDSVKLLLEAGADPNKTIEGRTALNMAINAGHVDIVEKLLDSPKIDRKAQAENALDIAKKRLKLDLWCSATKEQLNQIVRILNDHGIGAIAPAGGPVVPEKD